MKFRLQGGALIFSGSTSKKARRISDEKRKGFYFAVAFVAAMGFLTAQGTDPYKVFNDHRAMAKKGVPYPGAPLKGKAVGFANALRALPSCSPPRERHHKAAEAGRRRPGPGLDRPGQPIQPSSFFEER
jgi:hypothetical protein